MYCFGVDIGGTTVKMGLFEGDGNLIDKWEIKTVVPPISTPKQYITFSSYFFLVKLCCTRLYNSCAAL